MPGHYHQLGRRDAYRRNDLGRIDFGIDAAQLSLDDGTRLCVSHIVSIEVDGHRARVGSVRDTSIVCYDDPSEPLEHGDGACDIHDEPLWRLWGFELRQIWEPRSGV